jgi:hypothetical protein
VATFLRDSKLWPEIKARAKRSKALTIVSAYLGARPDELLKWPRHAVVVSDLSEATVRRGACSAKGALRLRKKRATILQCRDLHAKLYLFDNSAVVASANLSLDSSTNLVEAGVLLTGNELTPVRQEVQRIIRESVLLDDRLIRQWARVEPKHKLRQRGRSSKQAVTAADLLLNGRPVWLVDTFPYDPPALVVKGRRREVKEISRDQDVPARRIDWIGACSRRIHNRVREGDWIVLWWQEGTRSEYGRLEGPFECLAAVDLGKRVGEDRYNLALLPRRRRSVSVDARGAGRMFRSMSTRSINMDERMVRADTARVLAHLLSG